MRLLDRLGAAVIAFREYGTEPVIDDAGRYALLFSFWSGTWRAEPGVQSQQKHLPLVYKNSRQVWRSASAIVDLYEQFVYAGDLSSDGKPLPDGNRGAIPVDPQAGTDRDNDQLVTAIHELFAWWNWRQAMAFRPKMCAILGDCLTELVEDVDHARVMPRSVWPGYVTDLELDLVGNVKRYALEYRVTIPQSEKFGQTVKAESYTFRKEVDGEFFRYYKDGKPFAYPEFGDAEQPNPYGFVPAVWDRHEIVWGDRGMGALDRTLQAAMEMDSILSHALDYQRKQFSAPVGLVGSNAGSAALQRGVTETNNAPDEQTRKAAETLSLLPMQDNGKFVSVTFDVGKTVEMLKVVMDSILAENPEARYGQQILDMTQVTAPGVERALGPIIGRVKRVRSSLDVQTVKLFQMAIAMIGQRLANHDYLPELTSQRKARYDAFRPYDLTSYGKGLLDFTISDRPVIPESIDDVVARLLQIDAIQTPELLGMTGLDEAMIAAIQKGKAERAAAFDVAVTGISDNSGQPGQEGVNDSQSV